MGEREATVEQLDAMQEPLRRERMQHNLMLRHKVIKFMRLLLNIRQKT